MHLNNTDNMIWYIYVCPKADR